MRVNLDSGTLEETSVPGARHGGVGSWAIGADGERVGLVELASGTIREAKLGTSVERLRAPTVETDDGRFHVFELDDTPSYSTFDESPAVVSKAGCAITAAGRGKRDLEVGPWTVYCP